VTEQQLFTQLSTDAGITAITNEIYNGDLPESVTLPAVTMAFQGDEPINTLSGDTGRTRARYQINAWASTYSDAQALRVAIQQCMINSSRITAQPAHEEEISLFRYAIDYYIFQ